MHPAKYFLFVSLIIGYFQPVAGQQNTHSTIDSLITSLPEVMRSDETKSRQMIFQLQELSEKQHYQHGIIQTVFFKAWLSYRHDPVDVTIRSIDSALRSLQGIQTDTALIKFFILKGQCYVKKTAFPEALQNFRQALKIAEDRGDQTSKISTLISIGWAYMEDGKSKEAISFFNEVLELNPSDAYQNRAVLLCNIAGCYNSLKEFSLAEEYAEKGIAAAKRLQSNVDLANGLNILAQSYYQQGRVEPAINMLKQAAIIREKVAEPSMLASDYLELADLYLQVKHLREAIHWGKKAEMISIRYGNSLKLAAANKTLAEAYDELGDSHSASIYFKKLLQQKDSAADARYSQAFAQMRVQYESQKKVAENLELKKENLEARLRVASQQRWLFALIGGVILLTGSVVYVSKILKSRYTARLALAKLQQQKERIRAVIEGEEKERKRIAADLHDCVGQTLAAATLQLTKAKKSGLHLDIVDDLLHQACAEVRNVSHQITPEFLLNYGLVKAMEQGVDKLNDAAETTLFTLSTHVESEEIDDVAALTLYRCFQELCTNILKHAGARQVAVQLTIGSDEMELLIEDDGAGFVPEKVTYGLGMKSIQSRIALYDGSFRIDSTPGRGTTAIISLKIFPFSKGRKNEFSHA